VRLPITKCDVKVVLSVPRRWSICARSPRILALLPVVSGTGPCYTTEVDKTKSICVLSYPFPFVLVPPNLQLNVRCRMADNLTSTPSASVPTHESDVR
jgi:hypothetical protein